MRSCPEVLAPLSEDLQQLRCFESGQVDGFAYLELTQVPGEEDLLVVLLELPGISGETEGGDETGSACRAPFFHRAVDIEVSECRDQQLGPLLLRLVGDAEDSAGKVCAAARLPKRLHEGEAQGGRTGEQLGQLVLVESRSGFFRGSTFNSQLEQAPALDLEGGPRLAFMFVREPGGYVAGLENGELSVPAGPLDILRSSEELFDTGAELDQRSEIERGAMFIELTSAEAAVTERGWVGGAADKRLAKPLDHFNKHAPRLSRVLGKEHPGVFGGNHLLDDDSASLPGPEAVGAHPSTVY